MVVVVDINVFFILSTNLTTLRLCVLVVDDTVDCKDDKMEVHDIIMYHFS